MEAALLVGRISQSTVATQTREPLCTGRQALTTGSLCSASLARVQYLGPMSQGVAAQVA